MIGNLHKKSFFCVFIARPWLTRFCHTTVRNDYTFRQSKKEDIHCCTKINAIEWKSAVECTNDNWANRLHQSVTPLTTRCDVFVTQGLKASTTTARIKSFLYNTEQVCSIDLTQFIHFRYFQYQMISFSVFSSKINQGNFFLRWIHSKVSRFFNFDIAVLLIVTHLLTSFI